MELSPSRIQEEFENKRLDKNSAFEMLISLIENSDDEKIRIESVSILCKLGSNLDKTFKFLEQLLVSDSSQLVRAIAAKEIQTNYLHHALSPMQWAINHEIDYDCLITIIKTLELINNKKAQDVLIKEIRKINKKKYLDEDKRYVNKFRSQLKEIFKKKDINTFSILHLAEILINYVTILYNINELNSVHFEIDNGLVVELDLSNALEVRGTPWNWTNKISSLSNIKGLLYLTHLKKLNLNNNQINSIEEIKGLNNLTHLLVSNNQIEDPINIDVLKAISSLRYLEIGGNTIAGKINPYEFKNLEINLKISII